MNPFLRGMAIVAVIAVIVEVVLQLQATLTALFLLARIAFFLAIAFFVYMVWRERRSSIGLWSRPRAVDVSTAPPPCSPPTSAGSCSAYGHQGLDAFAFFVVLIVGAFAMFRVWRDQRSYGGY